MEVYFLDVGQGTCNLLLLGGQQAVVIDGGGRGSRTLLQALERFRVSHIVRLIVSHNDADHTGGTALWDRIEQQLADGILSEDQLHRLERDQHPKLVFPLFLLC